MPEPKPGDHSSRALKVAFIAFVIIEATAMVPLIIHLANNQ